MCGKHIRHHESNLVQELGVVLFVSATKMRFAFLEVQLTLKIPQIWKQEKTDLVNVTVPHNFVSWKESDEHMWIVQGKDEGMNQI